MLTAQTAAGVRRVQSGVPCASKARRDQSVPSTKRSPFGWIARLRDFSYGASGSGLPKSVGWSWPCQRSIGRPVWRGAASPGSVAAPRVSVRAARSKRAGDRAEHLEAEADAGAVVRDGQSGRTGRRNPPPVPDAASAVCRPVPAGRARDRPAATSRSPPGSGTGSSPFAARPAECVVHPRRRRPRRAPGWPTAVR